MADNPRIEELRRRVQADPASIAFAALAEEFRRAGRYREAIETCRTGLQRHPSYLSARVTLGRSLVEVGQFDEAREVLEHVLRAAPENLAAIRALADIHERQGETPEAALEHYRAVIQVATQESAAAAAAQSAPTPSTPPSVTASNPKPVPVTPSQVVKTPALVGASAAGATKTTTVAAPAKIPVTPSTADGAAGQPLAVRMPPLEAIPALVPHDQTNRRVLENLQRLLVSIQARRSGSGDNSSVAAR
jgi:tetratricopeptide (TPR) repeat protein